MAVNVSAQQFEKYMDVARLIRTALTERPWKVSCWNWRSPKCADARPGDDQVLTDQGQA